MTARDRSVCAPKGFTAAAGACGIKAQDRDVAVIVSDRPASAAGVFTTNVVCGAPVEVSRERIANGSARAIVVNSGNANACTGSEGLANARRMAEYTGECLGLGGEDVLVASTGIIGRQLPMDTLLEGIAYATMSRSDLGGDDAALAIMTTDTKPKKTSRPIAMSTGEVTVGGICKGSGMIAPNLATMLAFITTDATVAPTLLSIMLRHAVEPTFNSVTIDGDTSTSDMVIILANGAADLPELAAGTDDANLFQSELTSVCDEMARMIADDGEGATTFVSVCATGAASMEDARLAARTVASSPLVKTAIFGNDPNWGRIACAVGYSGAKFAQSDLAIWLGDLQVFDSGMPTEFDLQRAENIIGEAVVEIRFDLGAGSAEAEMYTCDFSYDYVKINAEYTT